MDEDQMVKIALKKGFEEPMKQLDNETLRVYNPRKNDHSFLRFVEGKVYEYSYLRELD